jgi:myosin-5
MEVGSRVWVRDPSPDAWILGEIVGAPRGGASGIIVRVRLLRDGSERDVETQFEGGAAGEGGELIDVKPSNAWSSESAAAAVNDLSSLPILNEPEMLSVVESRFRAGRIYTNTGPILLSVNPLAPMRGLYSADTLASYYSAGLLGGDAARALPPHLYATADAAFRAMIASGGGARANQTILISGESGSGKTEAAKILLQYLVSVGREAGGSGDAASAVAYTGGVAAAPPLLPGDDDDDDGGGGGGGARARDGAAAESRAASVERRVLDATPLLEAFGHAKTALNANSSRFGKLIDLQFDARARLLGARTQVYLLEKVRIVRHSAGERGFHIFYQLLAGARAGDAAAWGVAGKTAADFAATAVGAETNEIAGVRDEDAFAGTVDALRTMGFDREKRRALLGLVAAVLHLSNVRFESVAGASADETRVADGARGALAEAARLVGVAPDALERVLTSTRIDVKGEDAMRRALSPLRAADVRDALAKQLYGRLFDWLVARGINARTRAAHAAAVAQNIFLLDIFGFESFAPPDAAAEGVGAGAGAGAGAPAAPASAPPGAADAPQSLAAFVARSPNSLEQLCINLSNETLQQQFLLFAYKSEQAEYAREAVHVQFNTGVLDNEDVLGLIAGRRPPGILSTLDEVCGAAGNDAIFARRLYESQRAHARFGATPLQVGREEFLVRHYAGAVVYAAGGFVEKNKDTTHAEAIELLGGSALPLAATLFDGAARDAMEADDAPFYAPGSATALAAAAAAKTAAAAVAERAATLRATTVATRFVNDLRTLMAVGGVRARAASAIAGATRARAARRRWAAALAALRTLQARVRARAAAAGAPARAAAAAAARAARVAVKRALGRWVAKRRARAAVAAARAAAGAAAERRAGAARLATAEAAVDALGAQLRVAEAARADAEAACAARDAAAASRVAALERECAATARERNDAADACVVAGACGGGRRARVCARAPRPRRTRVTPHPPFFSRAREGCGGARARRRSARARRRGPRARRRAAVFCDRERVRVRLGRAGRCGGARGGGGGRCARRRGARGGGRGRRRGAGARGVGGATRRIERRAGVGGGCV